MSAKVKFPTFPKQPRGGYIAGWYVSEGKTSTRHMIEDGSLTGKEAKKLAVYVTQWAKWVEAEEKRLKKEEKL